LIGKTSANDQVGVLAQRGEEAFPWAQRTSHEVTEIQGELVMSHSKLASLAGLIGAALLVAAVGPGAASTAFAADRADDSAISLTVSTAGLDLGSETGARAALSRIRYAADEICRGGVDEQTLGEQMQSRACAKAAVERAVASMNLPALTAVSQHRHVTTMASAAH
jgi:UrcA family protein